MVADQPDSKKKLLVFLSHAKEDKPNVRRLYKRLRQDGFDPWLDEERLLPGQNWNLEIEKALRASDVILLCFSDRSTQKEGYIQSEYKRAMKYQEEKPEGVIFVIPVRLDECKMPFFIQELQWVDYPEQYDRLVMALNQRQGKSSLPLVSRIPSQVQNKRVEIILEGEFSEFTPNHQQDIVSVLAVLLRVESSQIQVLKVYQGSVVIIIEMPDSAANLLYEIARINDYKIRSLGIKCISIEGREIIKLSDKTAQIVDNRSEQLPIMSRSSKPHILFLFSDTGGGHRSAAEAIIEALQLELGDVFTTEMVDFFKGYAPLPLNRMPDWYPDMVKAPHLWGLSFKITNGRRRARAITTSMWPYVGRAVHKIVKEHPADLIVTVHPVATTVFLKALGRNRPPFVIVVTDMVTTHALWYDQRADLILVPTEKARQQAIAYEMDPEQVRVVGQPVAERYCVPIGNKVTLRKKLGWEQDKTIALLVGGGEGMGPLGKTARAIATSGLDVALAIVCGRNQRLKEHLESLDWPVPVYIYGFTHELPDFMRASDVLVSKAGPGTIAESLNANLPMILYAKLPGQEDGNVTFVLEEKVGIWAPQPKRVVQTLLEWVQNPEIRQQYVENCRRAARPDASRQIARAIGEVLELIPEKVILEN